MATLLLLLLVSVLGQATPVDDERARMQQALAILAERPMTEELVAAYLEIHRRAWRAGDVETAHEAIDRIVGFWEEREGSDSLRLGVLINDLALDLHVQGDLAATGLLLERALAIHEAALGPAHPDIATILMNVGNLAHVRGDYARARAVYEQSLKIREEALGADHPSIADLLNNIGVVLGRLGDDRAAIPILERAVAIREEALGPDDLLVAQSLDNLSSRWLALGEWTAAREASGRALDIRESLLGPDHHLVADTLSNLATVHHLQGDYETALPLHERALDIREANFGTRHVSVATALTNIANVHQRTGELTAARALRERALAIHESLLGPDHPTVADSLYSLATTLRDLGRYAEARPVHERALDIRERALGPDHRLVADSLDSLGLLLADIGDVDAALPLCERALRIREHRFGVDSYLLGYSLVNLTKLRWSAGDREGARESARRALAVRERALGAQHEDVADVLGSLAAIAADFGEHREARELSERALAIREAALGPDHPGHGDILDILAGLAADGGDGERALEICGRALALREAALGPAHRRVSDSLANVAMMLMDAGRWQDAWDACRRLELGREHLRRNLAVLTEAEAFRYLAERRVHRDVALSAATSLGDHDAAYSIVLDAKGRVARLTSSVGTPTGLDPTALALAEEFARIQGRLSRLAFAVDVADRAAHEARIAALGAERDRIDRELRRGATLPTATPVTTEDVRAWLPPRSAVVDLLVHRRYVTRTFVDGVLASGGRSGGPRVSAWILRADGSPARHVDLGPVDAIEAATADFLAALLDDDENAPLDEHTEARLRERVWLPLAAHLDDVDTVLLSPDGALGTLPFETLRDESGRYLVETFAFVYPTDVASLLERPAPGRPLADAGGSLLAVGGVDFQERASAHSDDASRASSAGTSAAESPPRAHGEVLRGRFTREWQPLVATELESRVVVDLHEDTFPDERRLLLQGADATEERLKSDMPRHSVLHLATHGFFRPEGLPSLWSAALDAARGDGTALASAASTGLAGMHPGLLSGLVLAGANRPAGDDDGAGFRTPDDDGAGDDGGRAPRPSSADGERDDGSLDDGGHSTGPPADDGYLTASEVAGLDLSGADLVVLSACETGLGRPETGEGLLGLRRAFHMAGAETVVSSLWSVPDRSTVGLMKRFYENLWTAGMERHAALRAAQLEVLRHSRERWGEARPRTWGAFVLSGEWR